MDDDDDDLDDDISDYLDESSDDGLTDGSDSGSFLSGLGSTLSGLGSTASGLLTSFTNSQNSTVLTSAEANLKNSLASYLPLALIGGFVLVIVFFIFGRKK